MSAERDYNQELKDTADHKYGYDFDFDVMHPYMIRAFSPFIRSGEKALEMGCYEGAFTARLLEKYERLTAIEASSEAARKTQERFGERLTVINSTFEKLDLADQFDAIFMTHTLEHLDDAVGVLQKVNDWLIDSGRFFLVVPNADAPSRQIAVKMGLIAHNSAVTASEDAHGHRVTYSFDTLERDVKASGLRIVHKQGIFFKALANFQWDRLLQTDIISKAYLDGCYELGLEHPRLCSSIFFLCEKG